MQFINFMLPAGRDRRRDQRRPLPQRRPRPAAPKITPAISNDTNVYPTPADLARSFTVAAVSEAATRARTRMWARFKAGN